MRAIVAATALCIAPAIVSAQAPQTKRCGDGTTSTRSSFACWGHGGVDTTHAVERPRAESPKHHASEAVQAGEPRSKHAKSAVHTKPKPSAHHARTEHHPAPAAKKKDAESHRGWLPWRHKKGDEQSAKKSKKTKVKKTKKHEKSSRLPVPKRPNGQPR
jgi:hypothetical protein